MLEGSLGRWTNDEDIVIRVEVTDEDGDPFDLDNYTVAISIKDRQGVQALSGDTTGGEIVKSDEDGVTSVFTATFDADAVGGLCPGTYTVGVRIVQTSGGTETRQLIIGTLQIIDGGF